MGTIDIMIWNQESNIKTIVKKIQIFPNILYSKLKLRSNYNSEIYNLPIKLRTPLHNYDFDNKVKYKKNFLILQYFQTLRFQDNL